MALSPKLLDRIRRKTRIRAIVTGTAQRPRLSVYVSNQHVTAQIVDDTSGKTLAASDSKSAKVKGSLTEVAAWVGKDIASKAAKAKVKKVVFDRGGRKYHGRVKALAEQAREAGLEF